MCALVSFLARSPYAPGLFPSLSHDELCLGRVRDFADGEGELRVRFDPRVQRFAFTCLQALGAKRWQGHCAAQGVEPHVERLLQKRLRWFKS